MRDLLVLGGGPLGAVGGAIAGFAALFALFGLLERFFPEDAGQQRWSRASWTNTFWWFAGYASRFLAGIATIAAIVVVSRVIPHPVVPAASNQPVWLQLLEIFLISDLIGYWVHRTFHGRRLWRFHSIHHSIEEVDWLAAARVHPVDTIVNRVMQTVPIFLLGFSSVHVLPLYALAIAVYPIFLHANVGWSYGPLKYVIASPAFHRWHHTAEAEGINKNYAALFPFLDIVFGTWYHPQRASSCYGLGGDQHMSLNPLRQLTHPFNLRAITTRPAPEGSGTT